LYGTTENQTAKISEYVVEVARDHGYEEAQALDIQRLPRGFSLAGCDAVIVGASIHMGEYDKYVRDFVKQNLESLKRVPSAFFSVSMTAAEEIGEARSRAEEYVERFLKETGWHPRETGVFADALAYNRYGFVKRRLVMSAAKERHLDHADTSRDYEYTDWEDVRRFAERFLGELA